ncbi:MAG TPA: GNAT family N-acetyltransferase [Xanthobacteraceae bacterium]|nr:GNAT family N-acetyltransferase [Xanthobacteraceae bacterium]
MLEKRSSETYREASMPVLETERLVLRAPRLEDVNAIAALANDRRIAQNTRRLPHPYTAADAEEFVRSVNTGSGEMALVVTLADGTLIGAVGLGLLEGPAPEVGYWLGVPYWGKGYATEAARAVIDFAFTELDHEALQAGARVTNPASRRILEKCGFQWTGVGLCRIRAIASSAPIDLFRLDRGLWASLKSWREVKRVA